VCLAILTTIMVPRADDEESAVDITLRKTSRQ
jgi:hypothetical protein